MVRPPSIPRTTQRSSSVPAAKALAGQDRGSGGETSALDEQIDRVNQRLKAAELGLVIERRNQKLVLRGTLPPRPGSDRASAHQQRLSLNLPATPDGLKQAERQAKIIAAQLLQDTFDWRPYLVHQPGQKLSEQELSAQIRLFERAFFQQATPSRYAGASQTTWETAYRPYLNKLQQLLQAKPKLALADAIGQIIQAIPTHRRSRQTCCTALLAFAEFIELDLPFDPKELRGHYGLHVAQRRHLPADELIVQIFEQIPNPQWQFVYGVMATYGLRNHEVFFADYTNLERRDRPATEATVQVLETTKTGSHEVWPFYPEWIDRFNLQDIRLPAINLDLCQTTLRHIGQLVTNQFLRYEIPFSPYDLRHAWAVRTIHFGLPDTVSARMMGHSVAIHNRIYHHWITRRDQQQAVNLALQRSPLSPPR